MARLPAPEDYALSAPRPSRAVTDVSPVRESPDLATGKVMQDIGLMMQQEAEKLDDTVATDALNKLQEKQLELTYGDDGFTKVLGGGVIKRPITTEYTEKIKRETEALGAGIGSTAARAKFQQAAAAANRSFTQKLFVHAAEQTDKYRTDTANAGVLIGAEMAKAGDVMAGLAKATPIVEAEIARRSLEGDAAKTFRQEALGVVHAAAIDGLLARGDPAAATLYLKTNSEAMSKKQTDHYDPILKAQNAYVGGKALAAETAGMDDVAAQKYISEKAGPDKAMADSAYAELSHRKQAEHSAAAEAKGSIISTFSQSPTRRTAEQLCASQEFLAMPKAEQGNVREYFRHQIQSAEDHARALGDRAEARARQRWDENPEALAMFSELADNPNLVRLSTAQVYSYAPYIGPKLVGTLEGIRRGREREGKSFEIPLSTIKDALPKELAKATGDSEVQQVNAFKGIIARSLYDWKQENPGKIPSMEEQQAIMRTASKDFVSLGLWNSTVPAYAATKDAKAVPKDFYDGIVAWAKRNKKPVPSDAEIIQRYQRTLSSK